MRINADFSSQAIIDTSKSDWIRSPESGVDRIMLDRIGDEVARATSIVRYVQGSSFSRHEHAKGEEFLVLEGVFSDEHADYVAGTYVRNPPGSGHAPFSEDGCRILVKLRQFNPDDLEQLVIDTNSADQWETNADSEPEILHLHSFKSENVQMVRLQTGGRYLLPADGSEVFVVSGSVILTDQEMPAESWLRFPVGHEGKLIAASDSILWVKSGHLPI